jgi:hypothetical protein
MFGHGRGWSQMKMAFIAMRVALAPAGGLGPGLMLGSIAC